MTGQKLVADENAKVDATSGASESETKVEEVKVAEPEVDVTSGASES